MAKAQENSWFVYMVECADQTLYTGITKDLDRRLKEHNGGKLGASYTRARRPVALVYWEAQEDRSSASKRESAIKKLTRKQKKALLASQQLG